MNNKLHIANLPFQITEEELKELFDKYGTIVEVIIPKKHNTNLPRGFAFITFKTEGEAAAAKKAMHGYECHDRQFCITFVEEKKGRSGRWS